MAFNQLAAAGVTIYAITKPLDNALKKIKSELSALAGTSTAVGGAAGLAGVAVAGLTAMSALAAASFKAAQSAASLGMEMHRNQEIFGQAFPLINKTIDGLSKSFGYTRTELADMSANLGLLFVGMGLNNQMVTQLSASFLKLGTDASVIYGMDLPDFMNRIEAGIGGANRGLHRMGIFIDENKVEWEKWRLASQGAIWMTEEQGKQMARTSLIMAGLSRSAGQAKWAHQQLGGTLRETGGRLTELWISFGEAVRPVWEKIIRGVNWVLRATQDWLDSTKLSVGGITVYWQNLGLYIEKFGAHLAGAMLAARVHIKHWGDLIVYFGNYIAKNWQMMIIKALINIEKAFENLGTNFTRLMTWMNSDWENMVKGMGSILTQFMSWVAGGRKGPFRVNLAETIRATMPEFVPINQGMMPVAPAFKPPSLDRDELKKIGKFSEEQLKKIQQLIDDNWKIFNAQQKKAGQPPLGPGMQNPLIPAMGVPGGFVGITDFAKKIQEGALGKDAYMVMIANNTRKMADFVTMFGPRLAQEMMLMGMVGP